MNVAIDAPTRPALRYYGGKHRLATWVIAHFPGHLNYVEPCGGAASVLLQKPRSPLELYNDLDGNVVNFFRVLRDRSEELISTIRLTPWARAEYESCLDVGQGDDVERARKFYVRASMSFNGAVSDNTRTYGWRHSTHYNLRQPPSFDMINNSLDVIASRLMGVQIESRDYQDVVRRFDSTETLIYFDPPYVQSHRTQGFFYLHDWQDEQHIAGAELMRNCAGFVVVSGYACPLYAELYEAHGWHRVDKEAQTNSGGKRIESLWLSPRTSAALRDNHEDLPLFGG